MTSSAFHRWWPPNHNPTTNTPMTASATIDRLLIADGLPNRVASGPDGRRHAGDHRERCGNAEPPDDGGEGWRNVEAASKNADPGNEGANRQRNRPRGADCDDPRDPCDEPGFAHDHQRHAHR